MFFQDVEVAPKDPVFGLANTFRLDSREEKIYLCVGVYQDENKKMPIMPSVKKAKELFFSQEEIANYLSFEGVPLYEEAMGSIVFGPDIWKEIQHRTYHAQTLGGTGAIRLGCEFAVENISDRVYFSDPTWPNHVQIAKKLKMNYAEYPYISKDLDIDFTHMKDFLSTCPPKSLIILQASCHNPTGIDLSSSEWEELFSIFQEKKLLPFFDLAYQGFGKGIDKDAEAIRSFAKLGCEMLVAVTGSKNFGLYGHRTGSLFIVASDSKEKSAIASQIGRLIRTTYSNPPLYGASIVSLIYHNDALHKVWEKDVEKIRKRIQSLRTQFVQKLQIRLPDKDFSSIYQHQGMFSFLGLDKQKVDLLREKHAVYLLENGRMNFAGLNDDNMEYVLNALTQVM